MAAHILVVEHDTQVRDAICTFLNRSGIATSSATTAEETLPLLQQFPVLMLLDLALPDGGAMEILRGVRELYLPTDVAVIASFDADACSVQSITELHPMAIFGKPFDFQEFAEWLNRFFGQTRVSGEEAKDLHRAHDQLRRRNWIEQSR